MNVLYVGGSDETAGRLEGVLQRQLSRGTVLHARDVAETREELAARSIDCVVYAPDGEDDDTFPAVLREEYPSIPVVFFGDTSAIPPSSDSGRSGAEEFVAADLSDPDDRLAYRVQSAIARADADTDGDPEQPVNSEDKHAARLEALHRTTRALFAAETTDDVTDTAIRAAEEILDLRANAVLLYDEDADELRPISWTDDLVELIGDPPPLGPGDSIAWRVFQSGEATAIDDVRDHPDVHNPETAVLSELHLPIQDHGMLIAASSRPESFDHQDAQLGELLAANLSAALDQIERRRRLEEREEELIRQNERLEDFASVVSHDLRNPLTVAMGRLKLAQRVCESEHLDGVERAHDRMTSLIEELLTLARQGREPEEIAPIDIDGLVTSCWRTVVTGHAELVVDIEDRPLADRRQFRQLFENLIHNAVTHGGENVTVTIGRLADGFYFEDNGPGIDPDNLDRIFEVSYSTTSDGHGFGLGIVRQAVEAHDWEIRATEGEDGGARFEITGVRFDQE